MKSYARYLLAVLIVTALLVPSSGVYAQPRSTFDAAHSQSMVMRQAAVLITPSGLPASRLGSEVKAIDQSNLAASTQSTISFRINRPPSQWSVMLQKRQWWGWETLYFRYTGDYSPFYGLSAGTYRVRITKWSGWETCSPASVTVNGWNSQMVTCIG